MLTAVLIGSTGCWPQQPFYFHQVDEDLAHYKGVATEISVPDVDTERLDDVRPGQAAVFAGKPRYAELLGRDARRGDANCARNSR